MRPGDMADQNPNDDVKAPPMIVNVRTTHRLTRTKYRYQRQDHWAIHLVQPPTATWLELREMVEVRLREKRGWGRR